MQATSTCGARISDLLKEIAQNKSAPLSEPQRETLWRLIRFLTHDISNVVPYLWDIPAKQKTPETVSIFRPASQALRALYDPGNREALVQVLSFPLGIIPHLYRLARHLQVPQQPVNLYRVSVVSSALVTLRILPVELQSRTVLAAPGIMQGLEFITGTFSPQADAEGFFVTGSPETTVVTYVNLLVSIIYNTIKNTLFAVADNYQREDPFPEDLNDQAAQIAWEKRQEGRVYRSKIRLDVQASGHWRGYALDNVKWLVIRDSAGSFPINQILSLVRTSLVDQFHLIGGVSRESAEGWIRSLPISNRPDLVRLLKSRLGLRSHTLVDRLLSWFLNPRLTNHFTIQEVMEMAAILRLSGTMKKSFTTSGFGLFGINTLSPAAGAFFFNYMLPDQEASGTETVIAAQSLTGLRHTEEELQSLIETT